MNNVSAAQPRLLRHTFPTGLLQCNCTILADLDAAEAMVIDPGDGADVQRILAWLQERNLKLKQIVVTHGHIDHVGGAAALRRATGAPLMHELDLPLLAMMDMQAGWLGLQPPETVPPDASPRNGDHIEAGGWKGSVLLTPGHTQGSLCLYFPSQELLAAGDTLFAGSIGRTDLPGGDSVAILRSIRYVLLPLPDETLVIAGHGPDTTIGREVEDNLFLVK